MTPTKNNLLTGKELAALFDISMATLYKLLKEGGRSKRNKGKGINLQKIPSHFLGGKRYWSRKVAMRILNKHLNQ